MGTSCICCSASTAFDACNPCGSIPEHGQPVGEPFAVHHFHEAKGGIGSTPEGTAIVDCAFVYTAFEKEGSIWLMEAPFIVRDRSVQAWR